MPIAFVTARAVPDDAEALGVPVGTDLAAADGTGLDRAFLEAQGFEGKRGQSLVLGPAAEGPVLVALGVGDPAGVDAEALRRAAAAFVRAVPKRGRVATTLLAAAPDDLDVGLAARAVTEGAALAAYRYTEYKSDPDEVRIAELTVVGTGGRKLAAGVERGAATSRAVALARDLVNTPPGDLTPKVFAQRAEQVAAEAGLGVEVLDEKAAKREGLGGLLGVGQGSDNPPRLVRLVYEPEKAPRSTLGLVGKGITFDSGGLSLKTSEGMMTMKNDMSGAAAVLAAMSVLPAVGARTKVIGYLCLAENMPSGKAIRPSDVLRIRNGKTVEVLNTDAEGRLVMADGLSLAVEDGVDAIVDVATLTGACIVALGDKVSGLMGNHEGFVEQVRAAADRGGEQVWPLPLPADYRKQLESEVADVKNIGSGRNAGALTAGLFLKEFVSDVPWAHLDIAGPARSEEDEGYTPRGGTGAAVRTLVELASGFTRPKPAKATAQA